MVEPVVSPLEPDEAFFERLEAAAERVLASGDGPEVQALLGNWTMEKRLNTFGDLLGLVKD